MRVTIQAPAVKNDTITGTVMFQNISQQVIKNLNAEVRYRIFLQILLKDGQLISRPVRNGTSA